MAFHSSGSDWASRLGASIFEKPDVERGRRRFYTSLMRFLPLLLAAALSFSVAHAQYPTRPVRVIVAFSPGGVTDIIARTLMPKRSELRGQPVLVENRAGAGGSLAAIAVKSAAADGSVLLVHSSGYAINAAINPSLPYDPYKDFIP